MKFWYLLVYMETHIVCRLGAVVHAGYECLCFIHILFPWGKERWILFVAFGPVHLYNNSIVYMIYNALWSSQATIGTVIFRFWGWNSEVHVFEPETNTWSEPQTQVSRRLCFLPDGRFERANAWCLLTRQMNRGEATEAHCHSISALILTLPLLKRLP